MDQQRGKSFGGEESFPSKLKYVGGLGNIVCAKKWTGVVPRRINKTHNVCGTVNEK